MIGWLNFFVCFIKCNVLWYFLGLGELKLCLIFFGRFWFFWIFIIVIGFFCKVVILLIIVKLLVK